VDLSIFTRNVYSLATQPALYFPHVFFQRTGKSVFLCDIPFEICGREFRYFVDDQSSDESLQIGWITGFVDGEGCFSINFIRQPDRPGRKGYSTGYQVAHEFAVVQGTKSVHCLYMMRDYFGVGEVYVNRRHDNHKEHLQRYCVRKRSDLCSAIIPFFLTYALRTRKRNDFLKFRQCMKLVESNDHVTIRRVILDDLAARSQRLVHAPSCDSRLIPLGPPSC
jgi:LAGLIDADG endonuclease